LRAGVEGVTEEESVLRASAVEETCVPEPARAGDEGVVTAATAQTAPENVVPFMELPQSSEEYEGSGEVNPVSAASTADKIAKFASASEEVLDAGTSEGSRHRATISPGSPWNFTAASRRRKRSGKCSSRSALRLRTTSTTPYGFTGRRISRSVR